MYVSVCVRVSYQRPGSQTGISKCFQLFCHLGGQSLEVPSGIFLITHPEHTCVITTTGQHVNTRFTQLDSPLDDLCDLGLPMSNTLLFGRQVLKIILQLTVLSRQVVHKRAELVRSGRLSMNIDRGD